MGLKDSYLKAASGGGATAAPSTTGNQPTTAAAPPAAPVVVQTTAAPPAAGGTRDLAAMRAKLASRQSGGVNPPEAAASQTEALFEPRTKEAPDGTAVPLDDAPATSAGPAASAGTTATETGSVASAPEPGGPALTRGQKAAATRAANKAKAAPTETPASPAGAGVDEPVAASVAFSLRDVHTDDLLAEIYKRVAARFA